MYRFSRIVCVVAVVVVESFCWWPSTHGALTRTAIAVLPPAVPEFFRSGGDAVSHFAADPDVIKNRAVAHIRAAEYPEHFFDRELFTDSILPSTRYEFIARCTRIGVKPETVGFLPYAVIEQTERLAVAFAEHRKWPRNPHIRNKCLLYAGYLAHYSQDFCQPLHLTIHYDGKAKTDGSSPRTGIHERVDGLIERLSPRLDTLVHPAQITVLDSLEHRVFGAMRHRAALVDTVYALEQEIMSKSGSASEALRLFGEMRAGDAIAFTATLFNTAWELSKKIEFEDWHKR